MKFQRAIPFVVMLATAALCFAQQSRYQTSDPYFGTVDVAIDTNSFSTSGDSAKLVVELINTFGPWKMIYYRLGDFPDSSERINPIHRVIVPRIGPLSAYVVSPGLYVVAVTNPGPIDCYSWIRCSQIPLVSHSTTRVRLTARYRTSDNDLGFPTFDYAETKMHSLGVVPKCDNGQSRSSLTLRLRDSLQVSYPFGAFVLASRGSDSDLISRIYLINDTVTTLTLDTGEVRLHIGSRFRSSATLQVKQPFRFGPGDSAVINVTLGGAYTIDSSSLFGGYQRSRHFYGTTSVRHEPAEEASSRDSAILVLEVVDAETQIPIDNAYAEVYEQFYDRRWTVTNGLSSFAVPTGAYSVVCDATGPEGCWNVSRENFLVLPGQRTIVRFELNMKQSTP